MNTSDYIVKKLEELGVNDFFGLPGDYNFNIVRAVENNPNTNWIGCTNELNAGYAADGYARIRGYGAIITTYGVGELSAINAIAGSYAENIPVINIVGIPATKYIENKKLIHHNFQEVNYKSFLEAYKQVTQTAAYLSKDNAKMEIDRIIKVFVKEKKPVYIGIPSDIADMEITDRYVASDWASDKSKLNELSEKIANKINKSKNPVIIGDALIKRFDAEIEYKEFVSKSNIPTTNFMMGINLIDMDSDNFIGGYFSKYRNPITEKYVNDSDCPISIGTIYSDMNSFGQHLPYDLNKNIAIYGNYTYFEGKKYDNIKMSDVLESLTELIEPKNIKFDNRNFSRSMTFRKSSADKSNSGNEKSDNEEKDQIQKNDSSIEVKEKEGKDEESEEDENEDEMKEESDGEESENDKKSNEDNNMNNVKNSFGKQDSNDNNPINKNKKKEKSDDDENSFKDNINNKFSEENDNNKSDGSGSGKNVNKKINNPKNLEESNSHLVMTSLTSSAHSVYMEYGNERKSPSLSSQWSTSL